MQSLPLRILPGEDLREALQRVLVEHRCQAAFVVSGIGSLATTALRRADASETTRIDGPVELLSLSGTLSPDGPHLHAAVADANGHVVGGHVGHGCVVRTTVEALLVLLPQWSFARVLDPATGYAELRVRALD